MKSTIEMIRTYICNFAITIVVCERVLTRYVNSLVCYVLQTGATFECTFDESNTCSNIWETVSSSAAAQIQWIRFRGPTQTLNTGPNVDHSTGNCKCYAPFPLS